MVINVAWLLSMNFPSRLLSFRKQNGFTQQTLADAVRMHVNQIKKYEAGTAQPTLDSLIKLAKVLHISLDTLVFDESERGPAEDLRLQFEAVSSMSKDDQRVAKEVLESLILRHQAKQWTTAR